MAKFDLNDLFVVQSTDILSKDNLSVARVPADKNGGIPGYAIFQRLEDGTYRRTKVLTPESVMIRLVKYIEGSRDIFDGSKAEPYRA